MRRLLSIAAIAAVCVCCSSSGSSNRARPATTTIPSANAQTAADRLCRAGASKVAYLGMFLSARPGTVSAARQSTFGHGGFHLLTNAFIGDADSELVGVCLSQTAHAHTYDQYLVGPRIEVHVLGAIEDARGPSAVLSGSGSATTGTLSVQSKWCELPISREAAIARVTKNSDEVPPTATAKAKLFGTDYWAVEVEGSLTPAFSRGGPFGWAVFDVDAHTGDIRGMTAGPPGSTPSDWDALPDPAAGCAHG